MALALGLAARFRLGRNAPAWGTAGRWLFGLAAVLASCSVARVLGHEQLIVGLALGGLALSAIWRVLPSGKLRAVSVALITYSGFGLTYLIAADLAGSMHFAASPYVIWNWTSYTTGVPALCAFGAAILLRPNDEKSRTRVSIYLGLLGSLLVFAWLNLQVFLYFESGPMLRLDVQSLPARDLALSIAWILYALSLLAVGMARGVSGLRQISLAFLLLTLIKVFLHDLGDLEGLYRVGSLLGLAMSLLLVSLLYQRFVFPQSREIVAEEESSEE